ncbi:GNAT family protein, partial [Acinetobacter baumannii]
VKGLTSQVMITALAFMFSLGIFIIMGEPDAANEKANKLVKKVGFSFLVQINMYYKVSNLYQYTREDFLRKHG